MALLLALAIGTAKAALLQGSDANATVVLFGSTRMPVDDENSTQEILKVDVGLIGAENATYQLMDQNDVVYPAGLYKTLSSGKQTVYFLTEMDSLFKLMNVTPDGSVHLHQLVGHTQSKQRSADLEILWNCGQFCQLR